MVDYNTLRKKFPTKDPQKKKRVAAIKAIKREYAAKRAALGGGAPAMKKGVVFYAVVILGLMILGSLILSVTGKGGPKEISRTVQGTGAGRRQPSHPLPAPGGSRW